MESNQLLQQQQDNRHNLKSSLPAAAAVTAADEPVSDFDLHTIPASSSWFQWDSIHETERTSLKEFFDGSSFTRTPKIYKDYRDFIISKYREDPSRRLTFTEVRRSLVGDVSLLKKVFNCLETWGLVNFNASPRGKGKDTAEVQEGGVSNLKVRVEEGAPYGVRVVAMPNLSKPLVAPTVGAEGGGVFGVVVDSGFKLPPLASYTDTYGGFVEAKELKCETCKGKCDSKYYECTKEKIVICEKCFKSGNFGENKSADDYKLNERGEKDAIPEGGWTEAETNLLLESVLKHGDDWDTVAQNVKTKTKLQCISRLIELPFGELMLGSHGKALSKVTARDGSDVGHVQLGSSEPQELTDTEDAHGPPQELTDTEDAHGPRDVDLKQNGEAEDLDPHPKTDDQGPPLKKPRTEPSDPGRSLLKQLAVISTMVEPHITSSAAKAAVSALCEGNAFVREIFDREDDTATFGLRSDNLSMDMDRTLQSTDAEMGDAPTLSEAEGTSPAKDAIPLSLQMRAAVATALGAAAARARLLADQEEREIEYLMATVVETQLKKLHRKIKHFEELELIMEKEHTQLEELKESIVAERIDILKRSFCSGISRWRDIR